MKYVAWKYSGGTYCGNGDFDSLDECLAFADDGFCDYVRVQNTETLQKMKIHFEPTDRDEGKVIYRVYKTKGTKCIRKFDSLDAAKSWCWLDEHEDTYRIEFQYEGENEPRKIYL